MMRISRAVKTGNFTQLDNAHVIRSRVLSFQARGVLAYLLSLPEEVESMSAETLARQGPDGKTTILGALRELRENGYLVTEVIRLPGGKTVTCQTVHEIPVTPVPRSPSAGNRKSVRRKPVVEDSDSGNLAEQHPEVRPPESPDLAVQQSDEQSPGSRRTATRHANKDRSSNMVINTPPTGPSTVMHAPQARQGESFDSSNPVAMFVNALPIVLRPRTNADVSALTETLYRFLAVGADPVALAEQVAAAPLPAQVFSPVGIVRSRLDAMDLAPTTPRPDLPAWCGHCESADHRWVELPGGAVRPCQVCSPQSQQAAGHS